MRNYILSAAVLATAMVAAPAHALLIDDFNDGMDLVSMVAPGPSNTAAATAVGGSRTLEILSGMTTSLQTLIPPGVLAHGQVADTGSSMVTWDANGAGLGGGAGVDLTSAGMSNGIRLEVISIDVGNVNLTIGVDSAAGSSSLALNMLSVGTESFFFTNFIGTADFTAATAVTLTIEATSSTGDIVLDLIDTIDVPPPVVSEPAVLALMGVGIVGLAVARRRA